MRVFLLIFLVIPFILLSQNKKDYKNYDKAVKYFYDGKLDKSKQLIFKLLKKDENWEKPNLLMARILVDEGHIEEAVQYMLDVYSKNDYKDVLGIKQIANLYYNNGFYKKALDYFEMIKNLKSDLIDKEIIKTMNNCVFAIEAIKNPVEFNPLNLGSNINTDLEEYLPSLSIDGNTLVFSKRMIGKDIPPQEDFYISIKNEKEEWGKAMPYPGIINTPNNEGAFSFSADNELVVYTACNRSDGKGRCDLYLMINNNTYNAGNIINTAYWESQGCFSPDGKYLYFVSNRPGGYGGKDIWRSRIAKDGFSEPENLGKNINTSYDEMSPFIHPDNLTFYFASNGRVGFGDYDLFVSRRTTTIEDWGFPKNMGYPINSHNTENSLIVSSDGMTAYYTSNKTGFGKEDIFQFTLPESLQADPISEIEMEIISQKSGDEIILRNVMFESGSYQLQDSSFNELDDLVAYLIKNPRLSIQIQGHTDNIGNEQDNQVLSEKRAEIVFNYLRSKVKNNLSYIGLGESIPLKENTTEEGRKINRRTSFVNTNE